MSLFRIHSDEATENIKFIDRLLRKGENKTEESPNQDDSMDYSVQQLSLERGNGGTWEQSPANVNFLDLACSRIAKE